MKTVLVTGGCGFIGSHFVRLAHDRTAWRVVNLDKLTYAGDPGRVGDLAPDRRYRFVHGDIADRELMRALFREERPWAVVNFAAESHVDRSILDASPFLETNVAGVQSLLEAARQHPVERFVQISTDEVYGDLEDGGRASEGSLLRPSSPYAASKAAADLLCMAYRRTHDLPVLITRGSNTYGPWQFPEKLIPVLIRHALAGEPLPLYGDGMQRRDWMYVTDHAAAILVALERGEPGAVYNVAAECERPNVEVARALCRVLADEAAVGPGAGLPEIRFIADRPGHDRRYAMDVKRMRSLGWAPRVGFAEGLIRTVRWYLRHRDWVERATSGGYREYREAVYARRWGARVGMKVAILGANGQLGSELVRAFSDAEWDVYPLTRPEFDVCDFASVREVLSEVHPAVVVNTAAFTRVDDCEEDTRTAFDVNAHAARNLACVCADLRSLLVHVSTDYVFDGEKRVPYHEDDPPNPLNVYGASKLAGEYFVRNICPRHLVVRTSGLYGTAGSRGKSGNFVETMLRLAREARPIRVVDDQVLTPTHAGDLAREFVRLVRTDARGVLHATNSGACSWYEFAKRIFAGERMAPDLRPTTTAAFGAKARRPAYSVLAHTRFVALGFSEMRPWTDALDAYLRERRYAGRSVRPPEPRRTGRSVRRAAQIPPDAPGEPRA